MCSAHLQFLIVHSPWFIYIKPLRKDCLSWFASIVPTCTCLCCGNMATPKQIPAVSVRKMPEPDFVIWSAHLSPAFPVLFCNSPLVSDYFLSAFPPVWSSSPTCRNNVSSCNNTPHTQVEVFLERNCIWESCIWVYSLCVSASSTKFRY